MKKIVLSILVMLATLLMPMTAMAAKENAKCNITVKYSSFATPSESDVFELTFKDSKGNEQSFDINAYSLVDSTGSIELPIGLYTIESLKYKGDGIIDTLGFAVSSYFIAANDDTATEIKIVIGHEEIKKMNAEDDSIKMYQDRYPLKDINSLLYTEKADEEIDWTEHTGNNYDLFDGEVVGQEVDLGEGYEHFNTDGIFDENGELMIYNENNERIYPNEETPVLDENMEDELGDEEFNEPSIEERSEILPVVEEKAPEKVETPKNNSARKSLITRISILGVLVILVGISLVILKVKGKI